MLRKEEILSRTNNGLLVFKHYLPGDWRIGRHFLNPFYQDKKASCNIYFDRHSGMYKMKDFGNDSYSGDCFFLVGQLKGLKSSTGIWAWGWLPALRFPFPRQPFAGQCRTKPKKCPKSQSSPTSSGNRSSPPPSWNTGGNMASRPNCWNITRFVRSGNTTAKRQRVDRTLTFHR